MEETLGRERKLSYLIAQVRRKLLACFVVNLDYLVQSTQVCMDSARQLPFQTVIHNAC